MIRSPEGQFSPGSPVPYSYPVNLSENFMVQEYLLSAAWENGGGILLLGFAGTGKTVTGIAILRELAKVSPLEMIYWTEHDFLADLRNLWRLEEMTQKFSRDDALWADYVAWERAFWDLKEAPFLFLDDACRGYTPMQYYEVENLLRLREAKSLPTIVASQSLQWENAAPGLTSVVERNSLIIRVDSKE
jgi:hypothetical protein